MNNTSNRKYARTWLALFLLASVLKGQDNYQLLRSGFSSAGGALQLGDIVLLESAVGTFATGQSVNSGNMLNGGMTITGKIQLFTQTAFTQSDAMFNLVFGKEQTNYRLISIPAHLDRPSPVEVLANNVGPYDKNKWRLFDCKDGKNINVEYPNTRDFMPGVALFLIVKEQTAKISLGSGYWVGSETYTVPLKKGWNLVGSPYNTELAKTKVKLISTDPTDTLKLYDYQGSWEEEEQVIKPWRGYAVAVNGIAQLVFSPYSAGMGALEKGSVDKVKIVKPMWRLKIAVECGRAKDEDNEVGVSHYAENGHDKLDSFEPPVIGDFVSICFPHPEWKMFLSDFSTDYRSPFTEGCSWDLSIRSSISESAKLSFTDVGSVPESFSVILIDLAARVIVDLRKTNSYIFSSNSNLNGKKFQLIIGTQEYIIKNVEQADCIPTHFRLSQNYPNPFNPSTTIVFELPQSERVRLRIVNSLGQEIVELAHGERFEAGRHTVVWDAHNALGAKAGSGVYFYQIFAGSWVYSRKMVLMQ